MRPGFLSAFAPDADGLLRAVSARVEDVMLREIAAADYGFDLEENFAALRALRDSLAIPSLRTNVREVLELTRWSQPDWPAPPAGSRASKGERGHWIRAFACAGLLRAYDGPGNEDVADGLNETLIQLTLSVDRLDAGLERQARGFIAWCAERYYLDYDGAANAFFGVALLWFALREPSIADGTLITLCEWTDAEESRAAAEAQALWGRERGRWLLSLPVHNQCWFGWEELGMRLVAHDLEGRSAAAREWVRLIGAALAAKQADS